MTFVIGLTGGIGSGKSTVAELFAKKGITIVDADQLARDLTQPNKPALKHIVAKFGPDILLANGALDRAKLRKIVFSQTKNRRWLEQLLHPLIQAEIKRQIKLSSSPYCIVVIPLLFETSSSYPFLQRILVVDTAKESQITRTMTRDNITAKAALAILNTQTTQAERLRQADDIIHNNGTIAELAPQVDTLHEAYVLLAKNR
ncbi:MAG: Dephospho-CoA kinase [uncultured bacterium]|nr:MAG: Dephospho-CoA kinase [uncultured bacterium]